MEIVNIHEAKTHLSKILSRVAKGEQIIIAKSGRPIARLVPMSTQSRRPGRLRNKIHIGPDFDAPLPEELEKALLGDSK